jgi:hypothetical protein
VSESGRSARLAGGQRRPAAVFGLGAWWSQWVLACRRRNAPTTVAGEFVVRVGRAVCDARRDVEQRSSAVGRRQ